MARANERNRRTSPPSAWGELLAIVLFFAGLLLFLALISYHPGDLPTWVPFSQTSTPNSPTQNFIGPFGAIAAGTCYFLFGAASYLIAVLLMIFGGSRVFTANLVLTPARMIWFAVSVVTAACLIQSQTTFLQDWRGQFNIAGPGGFFGYWIGERLFRDRLLGQVGSTMAFGVLYVSSVVLLFGLHPVAIVRRVIAWSGERREAKRVAALEAVDAARRIELERQRLDREQRRLEKQLRRSGAEVPGDASDETAADEGEEPPGSLAEDFIDRPQPQIIDSNTPTPAEKKPRLADVLARSGGRTPAKTGALAAADAGDVRFANYQCPGADLLELADMQGRPPMDPEELRRVQTQIVECLDHFGIKVSPGDITRGPTITRYEVYPAKGVRVDKIVSLERDIARATRAERINILAPIPGKDTVGIEIANARKVKVALRELIESEDWATTKAKIPLALGKDVYGKTIIADLAAMPHCLVAGTTGSGKSVCINALVASMLFRFTPEQLRFIMIDPKVVEMQMYNDLPHLIVPVVTDPKKVLLALNWLIHEMEKRYKIFAKTNVRNITGFNARPIKRTQMELDFDAAEAAKKAAAEAKARVDEEELAKLVADEAPVEAEGEVAENAAEPGERQFVKLAVTAEPPTPVAVRQTSPEPGPEPIDPIASPFAGDLNRPAQVTPPSARNSRDDDPIIPERMPYIVVIVDELADLMQTAPADVENAIARITQMARAAGIHMIVATQTPRADVVTGIIKANIPSRIAFQVASKIDSRVILDENGAERLLGQGDMLYLPPGTSRQIRAQGVLVTDEEIHRVVRFAADQGKANFEISIHDKLQNDSDDDDDVTPEDEELVQKCIEIIRQEKKASTSMLQRRLRLGYTRAARVVDVLERRGIVGPENGAKGREILVDLDQDL